MQQTKEKIAAVDERIQENASRRVRKLSVEVGISCDSIRSILKKEIPTILIKCLAYTSLKMIILVMLVL